MFNFYLQMDNIVLGATQVIQQVEKQLVLVWKHCNVPGEDAFPSVRETAASEPYDTLYKFPGKWMTFPNQMIFRKFNKIFKGEAEGISMYTKGVYLREGAHPHPYLCMKLRRSLCTEVGLSWYPSIAIMPIMADAQYYVAKMTFLGTNTAHPIPGVRFGYSTALDLNTKKTG